MDNTTSPRTDVLLRLPTGTLRGSTDGRVRRFLGIPYAAPPVGERRFAVPAPAEAWEGVRDATVPGTTAPHRVRAVPGVVVEPLIGAGWVRGDDYLTLNIWAPDDAATGRPVMVFVHGGGFVIGSKDAPVQNGATFARDGVVCVAINYRLNVDGFLPIPGVPTNLGLRDQLAALVWVRDNIALFGGDAGNVTVFGESAGAMAIANLVASPLAKGLFHRAIIQSGHGAMTRAIPVAQRLVRKLARILKVTPDRTGYAGVAPEAMLDGVEAVSQPKTRVDLRDADGREPVFGISRFIPVHGDDVLPEPSLDALRKGAGADVDVLIGSNAEEMNLYLIPTGVRETIGKWLATYVLSRSQPHARRVLRAYGMGERDRKPGHVLAAALSDLVFRWPARRFAEEHRGRTHLYEFGWRSPLFDGRLGAAHGMELPFVFDSLATVSGPSGLCGEDPPQALADRVHALWIGFARDGTLPWPAYDARTRQVYQLHAGVAVQEPPMPAAAFLP